YALGCALLSVVIFLSIVFFLSPPPAPSQFSTLSLHDALPIYRSAIELEWIQRTVEHPVKETTQSDGRIRRWAPIDEMNGRYLRVVLLDDGKTVHNAFFDRRFTI